MPDIVGKWVLQEGMMKGLWFDFKGDGTYTSELPRLIKITAGGTYTTTEDGLIDTNQTQHSMNMIGQYAGRYSVEGDTLKLIFGPVPGGPRPADLIQAGTYKREG